jgi:hypothetical protein
MRNAVDLPEKSLSSISLFYPPRVDSTELYRGRFGREEPTGGKRSDEAIWRSLNHRLDLAGYGIKSISTGRRKMPDELPSPTLDTES